MPDNIGKDTEQCDQEEEKFKKQSVIMFDLNTSPDKTTDLVHDKQKTIGEDICETSKNFTPKQQLFIQNN